MGHEPNGVPNVRLVRGGIHGLRERKQRDLWRGLLFGSEVGNDVR